MMSNSAGAVDSSFWLVGVAGANSELLGAGPRIYHYAQNCWYGCGRKSGSDLSSDMPLYGPFGR